MTENTDNLDMSFPNPDIKLSDEGRSLQHETFFTACISGDRNTARETIKDLLLASFEAEVILTQLIWPTLEQIQALYRADEISTVAHHYATRIMRSLCEQLQMALPQQSRNGKKILFASGHEESEEMGAQISADLLEAAGYEVLFVGGGVANDEIVAQIGALKTDVLVVFGAVTSTVPQTRMLIDKLQELGARPQLQIVVGGGIFARAEGLAAEIGADLWADSPNDLVKAIVANPDQRMQPEQRTVGRRKRNSGRKKQAA